MKGFLVFLVLVLLLGMLGVFQSGDDQIDYSDPEVMKAWEEVHIGINPYDIAQDSLEMITPEPHSTSSGQALEGDSLHLKAERQRDAKCSL